MKLTMKASAKLFVLVAIWAAPVAQALAAGLFVRGLLGGG